MYSNLTNKESAYIRKSQILTKFPNTGIFDKDGKVKKCWVGIWREEILSRFHSYFVWEVRKIAFKNVS